MPHWLATTRTVQRSDVVTRFDPRFWTVNFPRPMMAAVTTTSADALRVDAVFYQANDLAGLIWEAEDRWDIRCWPMPPTGISGAAGCRSAGARRASCRSMRSTARP